MTKKAALGHIPLIIIKAIIAILNWPSSNAQKLVKAKLIQLKLTGNPLFTIPYPVNITTLAQLGLDITAAETAQTLAETKVKGSAKAFSEALVVVHNDLISIMSMVQAAMTAAPKNAESICQGAGYDVKKETSHGARKNTAKSNAAGEADLTGAGAGPHQWQQSNDGGTTIIAIDPTRTGKTKVTGLASGSKPSFRNRQILTKGEYGDWSEWIPCRIE
jgi:hypothetical protein